ERDGEATLLAWRSLVNMPTDFVLRHGRYPLLLGALPACAYIVWELDLPLVSWLVLAGAALVLLLYGLMIRFFAMELAMRPVVEDIARVLPDGVALGRAGLPLRWKLLAGLPMINIITGVVVSGLSHSGTVRLSDLGVSVVVAVIVAFTLSFELTVLLSRSILEPIQDLRAASERVRRGDLSVRVPVISTDEVGALTRAFNNAVAGLEERERLREAFGSYVDPEIAERVLAEGIELEGQEVEVTVLFLDIRGFTSFAERSSAREVVTQLNDYFGCVVPVLIAHGGHANKFVGDGLLGVFGAPDPRRDHADRAVAAALEIAALVRDRYGGDLRIGIGVNSGPVVAGSIGGGGRLEFTVIGDPVNTAARVEEVTRETGDDVLITEATRCLLERDFGGWVERGAVQLKGKTEQVHVYAAAVAAAPSVVDGRRERAAAPASAPAEETV
ncbi:MAG TPA: adenylate/guanylate cyclase domain-containing protein, partial [Solirubrobacteraceae bacterium]|nr:adenylate/guanylate cyclase domain-containing protein [Solirubrobacteraceae bacterium]